MSLFSYKRIGIAIVILAPVTVVLVVGWWHALDKVSKSANSRVFPLSELVIRDRLGDRCEIDDACGNLVGIDCGYPVSKYHYVELDTGYLVCSVGGFLIHHVDAWCDSGDRVCRWREWWDRLKNRAIKKSECPPRKEWSCPVSRGKRFIDRKERPGEVLR